MDAHQYLQSELDTLDDEISIAMILAIVANREAVVSDHLNIGGSTGVCLGERKR